MGIFNGKNIGILFIMMVLLMYIMDVLLKKNNY